MVEATKNVFEKLNDALTTIADELHGANDSLYVVASEMIDLTAKIDALNTKLDSIMAGVINVKVQTTTAEGAAKTQTAAVQTPTKTKLEFPAGKGATG